MSTFASAFKSEAVRLARKELRAQLEPLRKISTVQRRQIAELKRVVSTLKQDIKRLSRSREATMVAVPVGKPSRFVAKGLRALRHRLGLSAEDLGLLAGVSGQSVRNWEAKISVPGKASRDCLLAMRSLGKREAQGRLLQIKAQARTQSKRRAK